MDQEQVLANLERAAVKLTPFTPTGWDGPIYLRRSNMADLKEELMRPTQPAELAERMSKDPYYIERTLARIVRKESGELVFDPSDDAHMARLKAVLDNSSPSVSREIQDAQLALNQPGKEVDSKGN